MSDVEIDRVGDDEPEQGGDGDRDLTGPDELDSAGLVVCMSCSALIDVEENIECIGMINGELDLIVGCPECGAIHNGFISFADFSLIVEEGST